MAPKALAIIAAILASAAYASHSDADDSPPTAAEFMKACSLSDGAEKAEKCDILVWGGLIAELDAAGGPEADHTVEFPCQPPFFPTTVSHENSVKLDDYYHVAVIDWINHHPEVLSEKVDDVLLAAYSDIFRCKMPKPSDEQQ